MLVYYWMSNLMVSSEQNCIAYFSNFLAFPLPEFSIYPFICNSVCGNLCADLNWKETFVQAPYKNGKSYRIFEVTKMKP
jgi:hypothetical protein